MAAALFGPASLKPLLRNRTEESQRPYFFHWDGLFLFSFPLKETTPTGAICNLMKQAENKIPINLVRDERRKGTYLVTLVEMGKYRAVSQSRAKNPLPLHEGKGLALRAEAMLYGRLLHALKHKPEKLKRKQSLILLF